MHRILMAVVVAGALALCNTVADGQTAASGVGGRTPGHVDAIPGSGGAGYWQCRDGGWTPVDSPAHSMPLKACGAVRAVPRTAEECTRENGKWGPIGIFPAPVCSLPTRDANRACGDSSECEGPCIAELTTKESDALMHGKGAVIARTGKCAARLPVLGCHAQVEHGVVSRMLCRD